MVSQSDLVYMVMMVITVKLEWWIITYLITGHWVVISVQNKDIVWGKNLVHLFKGAQSRYFAPLNDVTIVTILVARPLSF